MCVSEWRVDKCCVDIKKELSSKMTLGTGRKCGSEPLVYLREEHSSRGKLGASALREKPGWHIQEQQGRDGVQYSESGWRGTRWSERGAGLYRDTDQAYSSF